MKLAISNIAWTNAEDDFMYDKIKKTGFLGLEIAPTRWIEENPYEFPEKAQKIAKNLFTQYGFVIPSMQSIWYGRSENLFGTEAERNILCAYTKKAIDFAEEIGCKNLVFGCPKNRMIPLGMSDEVAVSFFKELGDYAYAHHTVLAMEANPAIYHTNYVNTTNEAIELIKKVESRGFLLNLDVGTLIHNEESLNILEKSVNQIHHIHISEPELLPIQKRKIHLELASLLRSNNYSGFISIEMGKQKKLEMLIDSMNYVKEIFAS